MYPALSGYYAIQSFQFNGKLRVETLCDMLRVKMYDTRVIPLITPRVYSCVSRDPAIPRSRDPVTMFRSLVGFLGSGMKVFALEGKH